MFSRGVKKIKQKKKEKKKEKNKREKKGAVIKSSEKAN